MPLTLGPSDYLLFDGQESVTFGSLGGGTVTVPHAVATSPKRGEVTAAGGLFDVGDKVFWIPAAELGAVVPKEGDTVTDGGGVTYTIDSVLTSQVGPGAPPGSMYRCPSKRNR